MHSAEKEAFHEKLNAAKEKCLKDDIVIMMGDLNAKVDADNTLLRHVIEKHVLTGLVELSSPYLLLHIVQAEVSTS